MSTKAVAKDKSRIPDDLIDPMMEIYKKAVLAGSLRKDYILAIDTYLKDNGCTVSDRTIDRAIAKHGVYEPLSARKAALKIDATREDEIIYLRNKIEDIARDLTDLFIQEKDKKNNIKVCIELADAILRQREAQVKILSLSGPKNGSTTMIDAQKGRIVMVTGDSVLSDTRKSEIQSYASARNFNNDDMDEEDGVIDG